MGSVELIASSSKLNFISSALPPIDAISSIENFGNVRPRFLQSFEVIAHLQLESLDYSDDTGWWLMYLRICCHPPPSGDDHNPVTTNNVNNIFTTPNSLLVHWSIWPTQILCLLAKLKLKVSAQVHAPPIAINFKIPRLGSTGLARPITYTQLHT